MLKTLEEEEEEEEEQKLTMNPRVGMQSTKSLLFAVHSAFMVILHGARTHTHTHTILLIHCRTKHKDAINKIVTLSSVFGFVTSYEETMSSLRRTV